MATGVRLSQPSPNTGQRRFDQNSQQPHYSSGRSVGANQPVYRRAERPNDSSSRLLMFVIMIALMLGGYLFTKNFILDQKLALKIITRPDTTVITINGKSITDGYTKTPANISLKPGTYTIDFQRPGYLRQTVRVRGKAGETKRIPPVQLRKDNSAKLTGVKIYAPEGKVYLNIDNGYYRGATPAKLFLEPGEKHSISFNVPKQDGRVLKCSFKAPSYQSSRNISIFLRPGKAGKGRCTIRLNDN